MTPDQAKLAMRMWTRYKTDTTEYRRLAESLGMTTGDLNARCWRINKDRKQAHQNYSTTAIDDRINVR